MKDVDMIDELQFTCPRCGSHYFGSGGLPPNLERDCHGYLPDGRPCTFAWHQNFDHLVMKPTGKKIKRTLKGFVPPGVGHPPVAVRATRSRGPEFVLTLPEQWRVFYVDGGYEIIVGILFADSMQDALAKGVERCREAGFSLAGIKLYARKNSLEGK